MAFEFESAFRDVLREVVGEVVAAHMPATSLANAGCEGGYLITSREAAERLSISQKHLHKLNRTGVLPCVRIGQSVRYSVATIQKWIRDSESTVPPPPRPRSTKPLNKPKPDEPTKPASKKPVQSRTKVQSKPVAAAKTKQTPSQSVRRNVAQTTKNDRPRNPFRELLVEIGVDRSALPPLTNGELMRISETDIATFHGWMYLNRPLPEEARERLKNHFLPFRAGSSRR